ncbi:MAG: hypothetical protein QM741_00705 [Rudaea sp.]|uniref:hypothetical protein n=1 Tax=Rudaea sp. TaxID=2136325 RepID=UPI0039E58CAE
MKTERVTLLTTPKFKAFLGSEAKREGISVAELVRNRFEPQPSAEAAMIETLTAELAARLKEARTTLNEGLAEFHAWLAEKNGAPAKQRKRAAVRRGRA